MDFGISMFPSELTIGPAELAREVEDRGFASLWFPEHTHIPVQHSPYPAGGDLPDEYRRTLDPIVALTAAAVVTRRIRLGTGVCLVAQHDPIVLAKEIASLDVISNGRVNFGIGVGWNEPEMANHGVDPGRRRAVVRENVLAMKALWTQEEASFEGEFVRFGPAWSWPKPVQRPHPPVLMGGAGGPVTFRHVAEYCDGWMPISGRGSFSAGIDGLRAAAVAAGRDMKSFDIQLFGVRPRPEVLEHYAELGVTAVILMVPPSTADTVKPMLDRYAELLGQV